MSYWFPLFEGESSFLSSEPFWNGNVNDVSAEYAYLKKDDGLWKALKRLELSPGVLSRSPFNCTNTSVDDYLARACDPEFAKRMLHHGRTHLGFLNCETGFKPRQFLYRFQGMWQHARISAGEKPGAIGQFFWVKSVELAAEQPVTNQDGWRQSHLMILRAKEMGWIQSPGPILTAVSTWHMKKPAPTWRIVADYIGLEDHPLVDAWRPYN